MLWDGDYWGNLTLRTDENSNQNAARELPDMAIRRVRRRPSSSPSTPASSAPTGRGTTCWRTRRTTWPAPHPPDSHIWQFPCSVLVTVLIRSQSQVAPVITIPKHRLLVQARPRL